MKKPKNSKLYIWIILIVCILYFILSYIAFIRSEVIVVNETTHFWRSLSNLLTFPMVYILNSLGISGSEIAAILIVNGLLWGVAVALLVYIASRIRT
jgi:hypothetical protein